MADTLADDTSAPMPAQMTLLPQDTAMKQNALATFSDLPTEILIQIIRLDLPIGDASTAGLMEGFRHRCTLSLVNKRMHDVVHEHFSFYNLKSLTCTVSSSDTEESESGRLWTSILDFGLKRPVGRLHLFSALTDVSFTVGPSTELSHILFFFSVPTLEFLEIFALEMRHVTAPPVIESSNSIRMLLLQSSVPTELVVAFIKACKALECLSLGHRAYGDYIRSNPNEPNPGVPLLYGQLTEALSKHRKTIDSIVIYTDKEIEVSEGREPSLGPNTIQCLADMTKLRELEIPITALLDLNAHSAHQSSKLAVMKLPTSLRYLRLHKYPDFPDDTLDSFLHHMVVQTRGQGFPQLFLHICADEYPEDWKGSLESRFKEELGDIGVKLVVEYQDWSDPSRGPPWEGQLVSDPDWEQSLLDMEFEVVRYLT